MMISVGMTCVVLVSCNSAKPETVGLAETPAAEEKKKIEIPHHPCHDLKDVVEREICLSTDAIEKFTAKLSDPKLSESEKVGYQKIVDSEKTKLQRLQSMTPEELALYKRRTEVGDSLRQELMKQAKN